MAKLKTVKDGFYFEEQESGKLRVNRAKFARVADELRRLGYKITYKANDRKTFHQRGVIRKLYEAKKSYINFTEPPKRKVREVRGIEYNFKFQKLTPKQRKIAKASKAFSKDQFTPAGIWIEKPANVPAAKYKVKFRGTSDVVIEGNKRRDVNVKIDAQEMAIDPRGAVEAAIKRGKRKGETVRAISLMVNGWSSKHQSSSLDAFYAYLTEELLPEWLDKNMGYHDDDEDEALEQFTDIFHAKLLLRK